MKKYCIFILILCLSILTISCVSTDPIFEEETPYRDDFDISYVNDDTIKTTTINLAADYNIVITEWLKTNKLDSKFQLVDSFIGENEIKESLLTEEYHISYANYHFYFSADLGEFLSKEENSLYYDALIKTLNFADNKISNFVSEFITTLEQE